jgi:hypothetical protein
MASTPLTNIMTVAAQQYFSVSEILLRLFDPSPANGHICQADLDFAEDRALRVCGLACTNDDVSGRVNAFGPLAFCKTSDPPFPELNEVDSIARWSIFNTRASPNGASDSTGRFKYSNSLACTSHHSGSEALLGNFSMSCFNF